MRENSGSRTARQKGISAAAVLRFSIEETKKLSGLSMESFKLVRMFL